MNGHQSEVADSLMEMGACQACTIEELEAARKQTIKAIRKAEAGVL